MDNKEAKVECLKIALEYSKIWSNYNGSKYKTEPGIIEIAEKFWKFVSEDE